MKVKVGISNRHIHLTENAYRMMFEKNMSKKKDLNQPSEFAANETVTIEANGIKIENVRIIGPFRKYNQVEITNSDARKLKINPPVRKSGDLENAIDLIITTSNGSFNLKNCCIIPNRHVHMSKDMAKVLRVNDDQEVKLKVNGIKGGEVTAFTKITDNGYFEVHIDTDDANSMQLNSGDEVELII